MRRITPHYLRFTSSDPIQKLTAQFKLEKSAQLRWNMHPYWGLLGLAKIRAVKGEKCQIWGYLRASFGPLGDP